MKTISVIFVLLLPALAFGQQKFLDRETKIEIAAAGALISADLWSTRYKLSEGKYRETNPLARNFVSSDARAAGLGVASFSGMLGGMYIFRNHPRIKRIIPLTVSGIEAGFAISNMKQQYKK